MISSHRYFDFLLPCLLLAIPFLLPSLSLILQGISSSTMSSFLFDLAISMGGNDYGGSIEQPMMNMEIISIGGYSSKDTRRGAFDNESSSSERVRASCRTGQGTSRPCRRAQPSISPGEPIPIIVILSPSAYGV